MHTRLVAALAASAAVFFAAACSPRAPKAPAPLATVSPLPAPATQAPIVSVAPVGDVNTLAQVRVRFSDDLIPLERLESPDETAILAHFSVAPAVPGQFRFLTPRMIGFEPDKAWPVATRVRVAIAKGVRDLRGHTLDQDVSWTFQTGAVELYDLPWQNDGDAVRDLHPKIRFSSNVALDKTSLQARAHVRAQGGSGEGIALVVPSDTATPGPTRGSATSAQAEFDPSVNRWNYVLVPARQLAKATRYDVVIEPGVLPRDGNRPSDRAFTGSFRTYETLKFAGVRRQTRDHARFSNGDPYLTFTGPIDEKSFGALALSPAPPKGSTVFATWPGQGLGVAINTSLLTPNTDYTVSMGPDLQDTFGQKLGSAQTATFRTGDLSPDVWAPSGVNLFPVSRDVRLNVVAVNAPPEVEAIFHPLTPLDVVRYDDPEPGTTRGTVLPSSDTWPRFDARGPKNVERTIQIPLKQKLNAPAGALAYGILASLGDNHEFNAAGVVQLTDLGAFAQFFPARAIVRVNRISNGIPVAGAHVDVYRSQTDNETKTTPVACASATTNADGVAKLGGAAYAHCSTGAGGSAGDGSMPASLVTIVRKDQDWSYVRTSPYSGAYAGDFYNGWSAGTPMSRGTIFSDRRLYQPGETAQMTAFSWFLVDGTLRRGTAPSYALTLEAPGGDKRDLGRGTPNAFGTFSYPVVLAKNARLGYYTVRASAGNGEEIVGDFRVAEFKPPNFKVDLALDRLIAQRGATVAATATNAYLFGAPLAGASTKFTVTRSPTDFTPKGRDAFTFGRRWFWPDQAPDAATDVLETTITDDAGGKSSVNVPMAPDLPYPMAYQVDAETTDASNVSVADGKSLTALPSDTLIGVKADDVANAGSPLSVNIIATDPTGAARAGTAVHVELQRANYTSATQIVEGAEQPVQSVSYETVASADATSGDKPATVPLTPPKPGVYRLRANVAGAQDDAGETDVEVYVGGGGETMWYARDPNSLTVKLDKATYAPGDTATALVQSPFPSAELHLAVVRHGVLWETTQRTSSAAPVVKFKITSAMLPNAAVEAFIVRRGAPPAKELADGGNALARVGFAPLGVALDGKYITAKVTTGAAVLAPAARQTVTVRLTDAAHHPIQGQATVIVANDAVLQLTGYRPPDLVKIVYAEQPISTRYSDNRSALVLTTIPRPVEKGWGFGGGLSGEEADPRVRRRFQALAYFAGALRTDANGVATTSFTLPDDLTTWRVMVVATSADGRFGNGENTFRTTKPLVANPVVPQFARPGDNFDAGVAVTNGTGASGQLHIDASFSGPLSFLVDGARAPSTSLDTPLEQITRAYRFPTVATGTGTATATIRVRGAGAGDAFAIPVPVRDQDVSESVAQTGTTDARAAVDLNVAADTPRDAGGVDVALASSLIPEVTVAAQSALHGDERVAISAASRLAIAGDLVMLAKRAGTDATPARDRAGVELATLSALQRADGGFAPYWRSDKSDPWDSLFALAGMARARDAGIAVDGTMWNAARAFAAHVLDDPTSHEKWCKTELCKAQLRLRALDALAAAGDMRSTFLGDIDSLRDQLSFADQARLARLLTRAPGYASRSTSLAKTIEDHLYTTGRGAVVNLPGRYEWFDEPVVAQSEALRLELVRSADGETIDRLTRSLLDMRRNGSFGCACENAAALGAIVDVAARERPANFAATATLAGKTIASERFSGARAPQRSVSVPMRTLPGGRSTLALAKDGTGTLHWSATYTYRLAGVSPGRLSGLRVTRVVREANASAVLATMGLTAPAATLTLPAARVFDVELQIISDHPVERVVISDPLPAGFEGVDAAFATTSHALTTPAASWEIGDQQIHADKIEAYADHLDAGIFRLHYLARSVTPGTFAWPGAEAHVVDRPDEFGRSATTTITVH